MAVSSLKFRIEGENSSALRSISDVKRAASDLGGELQRSIGDKLKGVFSVVAVEEMVRRTGEWATELQKSARELGMTGEQLQSLRVMAERAGVSTDKLFNFYNKLESAATKAANGNAKLSQSFAKLGVTASDLKGPHRLGTADLFQKTIAGGTGQEGSLQSIYGSKSYLELRALSREAKGRTLGEYQSAHQSQIVPEAETTSMAKAWTNIGEDLKSIGNKLAPLVGFVLSIVDGLLKMVSGVIGTITGVFGDLGTMAGQLSVGDFKGAGKTVAKMTLGRLTSMGAGIGKAVTFGFADKAIDSWVGNTQEQLFGKGSGLSEEEKRESEGAGAGVATVASFGTAPWAAAAGGGLKGAKAAAGAFGASTLAGKLGRLGSRVGTAGDEGLLGIGINKYANWKAMRTNFNQMGSLGAFNRKMAALDVFGSYAGIAGAGLSAAGTGMSDIGSSDLFSEGLGPPPSRRGILSKLGGQEGGSGGSKNLAIGGVFGVDVQSKIVQLNSKMVDLLQEIVENTTPDAGGVSEDEGAGL